MLIDFDGSLFDTARIAVVRPSGLNSRDSIIFTTGQSAIDSGFLVHIPYKEVCRRLRESRMSELLEMAELMDAGNDYDDEDEEESTDVGSAN
jgi:hypothetical protein